MHSHRLIFKFASDKNHGFSLKSPFKCTRISLLYEMGVTQRLKTAGKSNSHLPKPRTASENWREKQFPSTLKPTSPHYILQGKALCAFGLVVALCCRAEGKSRAGGSSTGWKSSGSCRPRSGAKKAKPSAAPFTCPENCGTYYADSSAGRRMLPWRREIDIRHLLWSV